jgi:hypothetical protein
MYYDVVDDYGFPYHWNATKEKRDSSSSSGNRCMSTMSWAYTATGQKRYLDAADKHTGKKKITIWTLNGFGQEYMLNKLTERADAVPPATVQDLAAEALGGGKVKLSWTAPGDDGAQGTAVWYQVKYASLEIKERSDWRTEADKAISFWAAVNVKGEPKPSPAGTKETLVVEGVAPGVTWFAMKSYDGQPNQSDLSNVVRIAVK